MARSLLHRGPDDEGMRVDVSCAVSLAVRRLRVIDVDRGAQPMSNEDDSVWVVLNGEVYNHRALRERLADMGHRFRTACDTEVLVHLYEEYGEELVHALDGMYAFALWDSTHRRLLLGRDRYGEKPLFYRSDAGGLRFASELTAIVASDSATPELRAKAVDSFFILGYVPGPGSIVEGVCQLPPGHLLTWKPDGGAPSVRPYWAPPTVTAAAAEPIEELTAETGRLLEEAVASRLVADVPVGVFLSGGVDSSAIAALAARASSRPLRTYTIGYDVGDVSEIAEARRVANALGAEHTELTLSGEDAARSLPGILGALDQPLADQALIPLHELARLARREVTVAVGGEGADELFGGYPRYRWLDLLPSVDIALLPERVRRGGRVRSENLQRISNLLAPGDVVARHLDWVSARRRHMRSALYGRRLLPFACDQSVLQGVDRLADIDRSPSTAASLMRLDQLDWLPDNVLAKADRASMLASLEFRTPYLKRELGEFAASVRTADHLRGRGKHLLREFVRGTVPKGPSDRRKTAFRVPAAQWLRGPLRATVDAQLERGAAFEEEWLDRSAFARLASQHAAGSHDWSEVIWPMLSFGIWLDRYRDGR